MKLLIFGIGRYYLYWKSKLWECLQDDEIIAFVDNRSSEIRNYEGKFVYSPKDILTLPYDKIILMSTYALDMHRQLINLGITRERILFFDEYVRSKSHGKVRLYIGKLPTKCNEHILLLMDVLGYNGGTRALLNAAIALRSIDREIVIGASSADKSLLADLVHQGLNIIIAPSLPSIDKEEWFWIDRFDIVVVNVFQMIEAAYELCKRKPILWWIHEAASFYAPVQYMFPLYSQIEWMKYAYIVAVSEVAKRNFEHHYPGMVREVMPYGLPDEVKTPPQTKLKTKFVFAVIGYLIPLKAQDIFLKAAALITARERNDMEFWLIGEPMEKSFVATVHDLMKNVPQSKMLGVKTQGEMRELYSKIDVVVCPSWQECLSTVIVEGMMHSKICLVNPENGMSKFIVDGINGFVFETGDPQSLGTKMWWIYQHQHQLDDVRRKARKTYESYFSMKEFSRRISVALERTKLEYRSSEQCVY